MSCLQNPIGQPSTEIWPILYPLIGRELETITLWTNKISQFSTLLVLEMLHDCVLFLFVCLWCDW